MNPSLLIAEEIPLGYSWTLASRLGDMLALSQEMFGQRDQSYTILGFEFCETGPRIWYPKSEKNLIVQLSLEAINSEKIALYQLAHECIHLLSPTGKANANVLEEGLAVYFSWWFLKEKLGVDALGMTNTDTYKTAGLLVRKLLQDNPAFFKEARKSSPVISFITKDLITSLCPGITWDEANFLELPFEKLAVMEERGPALSERAPEFKKN